MAMIPAKIQMMSTIRFLTTDSTKNTDKKKCVYGIFLSVFFVLSVVRTSLFLVFNYLMSSSVHFTPVILPLPSVVTMNPLK